MGKFRIFSDEVAVKQGGAMERETIKKNEAIKSLNSNPLMSIKGGGLFTELSKKIIVLFAMFLFYGALTAQNQQFLNAQFLILDQVQPLTQAERVNIGSVFNAEFAISGSQSIAFNLAMLQTLTNFEYFEHYYSDAITARAQVLYNEDLIYYTQTMGLSSIILLKIKQNLLKRARELAICEVCLLAYPDIIDDCKDEIKEDYFDDISVSYISDVIAYSSIDLGLALQYRDWLGLGVAQVDSIFVAVQTINQLTAKGTITEKENNIWLYERDFIMKILDEEQVKDFTFIRHAGYAYNYANTMWNEGKSYKMDSKFDSVKVVTELYYYRANWAFIQYAYRDNKDLLREKEGSLNNYAYPEFLTQLVSERRKRENEEEDKKRLVF